MTFLPIVARELRIVSRQKKTCRLRLRTATYAISFAGFIVLTTGAYGRLDAGALVLSGLAAICFLSCLGMAGNTVDCISSEKREGTLGFLFLTDLKGHDVALGKLFSTSLNSFYALLGTFPVVAVALLLGGVTAREFWEVSLALLNAFFFAQTASLLVSTMSRKFNYANLALAVLLLGYTVGLSVGFNILTAFRLNQWAEITNFFNPAYCVFLACQTAFRGARVSSAFAGSYWISFLIVHLNAWAFLAAASWRLPHCWQEKVAKRNLPWRVRFRHWYRSRYVPRRPLLEKNPFFWLAIRNRLGAARVWAAVVVIAFLTICILSRGASQEDILAWCGADMVIAHVVLKLIMVGEATTHLEEQRRSGALEFLLNGTPLAPEEIIRGQWLAIRRQMFAPTLAILATDFGLILLVVICFAGPNHSDSLRFVWFVTQGMVMLVADIVVLGWVGMWNAMSKTKPRQAAGDAIAKILVMPWTILIVIQGLAALWSGSVFHSFGVLLAIWIFAGVIVDIPSFFHAQHKLLTEFRARASMLAPEELGIFGQLGRMLGMMLRRGIGRSGTLNKTASNASSL